MLTRRLIKFQFLLGRTRLLVALGAALSFLTLLQVILQLVVHETIMLSASLIYWNVLILVFAGLLGGESWTYFGMQNGVSRANTIRAVVFTSTLYAGIGVAFEAAWWAIQRLCGNHTTALLTYVGYTGKWNVTAGIFNALTLWMLYMFLLQIGYSLTLIKMRMDGNQRGMTLYIWLIALVGIVLINWVPRAFAGKTVTTNWLQRVVNVPALGPALVAGLMLIVCVIFMGILFLLVRKLDLHASITAR